MMMSIWKCKMHLVSHLAYMQTRIVKCFLGPQWPLSFPFQSEKEAIQTLASGTCNIQCYMSMRQTVTPGWQGAPSPLTSGLQVWKWILKLRSQYLIFRCTSSCAGYMLLRTWNRRSRKRVSEIHATELIVIVGMNLGSILILVNG